MSKPALQPLAAIRQQGYRLTPQRQVILDVLAAISDHCTPEAVYRQVRTKAPAINRATVYRTLEFFLEIGLVTVAQVQDNQTVYELAPTIPHHHLICQQCNQLIQIDHNYIAPLFADLDHVFGFQVKTNHLILFGLCQHCRSSEEDDLSESAE